MTPVGIAFRLLVLVLMVAFLANPGLFEPLLLPLTRNGAPAIYVQGDLVALTLNHLAIVAMATGAATIIAVGLAMLVSRPSGVEFLPLSRSIVNIGQTFPPVAVLAIAVPLVGFGDRPALIALFLYGLLPIFENALVGLTGVPAAVADAARGMGLTPRQILFRVDLPLALPLILSGVRLSAVIALSTAAIGSTVAAKTLGEVIIAGLLSGNTAFVVQGGLLVAGLAILIDGVFVAAERFAAHRVGALQLRTA
ncbi:MAG: ABC transporter permease [Bauldia sp.]|nr:ABC transporter permease [Bauldia sp.]